MSSIWTILVQQFQAVICRTDHITTDSANMISDAGPWDFSSILTIDLEVNIDAGGVQIITIESSLFADDTAATAVELASQVNALIVGGVAAADAEGHLIIASSTMGDPGSISVGGAAGTLLGFRDSTISGGAYDDVWGAPLPQADGTQEGESSRREHYPDTIRCQLDRADWGTRKLIAGGEHEQAVGIIVVKKDDLRSAGLLGSDGLPMFHVGDRVDKILNIDGGLEIDFPDPPGMWIQKIEPAGFGLAYFGTPEVNLFYLHVGKDRVVDR